MDVGVVRLILATIAAALILCVSVSGTDLTIVLLGGIALVLIRRTWKAPLGPPVKPTPRPPQFDPDGHPPGWP